MVAVPDLSGEPSTVKRCVVESKFTLRRIDLMCACFGKEVVRFAGK